MFNRVFAIIKKEILHIIRDPKSLAIIFIMPIMMVLLYGYALDMDIKNIPIGIIDRDKSPESRDIIRNFSGSNYFKIKYYLSSADEANELFKRRQIKAVLVIPENFGDDSKRLPVSKLQLLIDGSDPTLGNAAENYTNAIILSFQINNPQISSQIPLVVRERYFYNTELSGAAFIIPGLVAVILMMVCALLTSLTVSKEKEMGSMNVLLVSPVKPIEILVGKVIPYIVLSLVDSIFIIIIAKIIFHIPLRGDLLLLFALTILYVYCALGIGLFISSVAPSQQIAMMAALVSTIMPSVLLSGFIFPIFSMPDIIKAITYIVPAKYYIEIIRGILLKASTFDILKGQVLFLFLLGTLFILIASLKFKTRVK